MLRQRIMVGSNKNQNSIFKVFNEHHILAWKTIFNCLSQKPTNMFYLIDEHCVGRICEENEN